MKPTKNLVMADGSDRITSPTQPVGKSVIVTGGTRRLGRFICEALAQCGFDIVATYSSDSLSASSELADFMKMIKAYGVRCSTVCADFLEPTPQLMSAICESCPSPLFGLVNNAAIFRWDDLNSLDANQMRGTIAINLLAPMLLTSEFSRCIRNDKSTGIALFLLDQKIFNPYPDHLTYTVCKAALNMFVAMCALDVEHIKYYGLAPGLILPAPGQSQDAFEAAQRTVLLGSSPTPDDIQRCVRFLFKGTAASGYVLKVDGGANLTDRARDFSFFSMEPEK